MTTHRTTPAFAVGGQTEPRAAAPDADRELLELAAKAAGIELRAWYESVMAFNTSLSHPDKWWNPLTDDGDALRLAVKCQIDVEPGEKNVLAGWWLPPEVVEQASVTEVYGADPSIAVRRAIVRAAAEIGRMPSPDACYWVKEDEDSDAWATGCEKLFCIIADTPSENDMKFCCYCGKPLVEVMAETLDGGER